MEWNLITICFAASISACVGFLSGIFGIGGAFLLVPILNAILGVPMTIAVGSTACYSLGPATVAFLARRPRAGFLQLPLVLAGGLLAGVILGSRLLLSLEQFGQVNFLGHSVEAIDLFVLGSYCVLMILIATLSLRDGLKKQSATVQRRGVFSAFAIPPVAEIHDLNPSRFSIPLLAWTGVSVGFLSGFLGMSGGLVLIPASIYLLGLRPKDATTVTVAIVFLVSFQATALHALHGNVQRSLVAAMLIGGTLGAAIGSKFGMNLQGRQIKLSFGILVLLSTLIVIGRLFQLWANAD